MCETKWVSVEKEGLPKEGGDYLITLKSIDEYIHVDAALFIPEDDPAVKECSELIPGFHRLVDIENKNKVKPISKETDGEEVIAWAEFPEPYEQ